MRKAMACLVALVSIGAAQSNAAVIYSTLGPGNSFNTGIGWSIASGQYIAMPFTVAGGDYFFNSAEVALFGGGGVGNNVLVRLRANNAGLPGAILETLSINGSGGSLLRTANSAGLPILQNGSTYWLEVLPATPLYSGGWNWANAGFTGPFAFSTNGGVTYFNTSGQLSAFRINGTLTPEPFSLLVFGGVLAAGGLAVRRRMKATV